MTRFAAPISEAIWDMKYRFKRADGTPVDGSVEDSWRRIAGALASVEADPAAWEGRFYAALEDFRYLPAGRITAGAGTARAVTLFNCFVMGTIEDSMGGIFDALKEAALTMQQGGGIGYDFSTIRPKGAPVAGVGADASGPLSFMDVWDAMCRTIMSAGSRRGAMMAVLRCDHPDIEDFVAAKSDPARLRMFNMSVLVTDPFMEAVKADGTWDLTFGGQVTRTIRARDLWDRIMRATYDYAEPGVIFIDRINAMNNLAYAETIAATNPCGEQPLPPYGACLLGSINLARLVSEPFTEAAGIDEAALDELVRVAVRMMDDTVDASNFPLPQQRAEAQAKRRIGLGVTGLADALMMVGLRYGSEEAAARTEGWMKRIARAAYLASVDLAREKGPFPLFEAEAYLASGTLQQMDADVREAIRAHGIRNALLTSIAPTGTISLYAGNVSSGIEPVFAHAYTRKVLQKDGSRTEEEVVDYAVALWREMHGDAPFPDHFVTAQELAPEEHVRMQAAAQRWVDSSISKTINVPATIGFEAFEAVYMQAWDEGCKGCTTYRPNDVTGSVLTAAEPKPEATLPVLQSPAARLRWAQEKAGYETQQSAADAVGVKRSRYSLWVIEGKQELSKEGAELAGKAFGVPAGWLLFGEAPPPGGTPGRADPPPRGGASAPPLGSAQPSASGGPADQPSEPGAAPEIVSDANSGDVIWLAEPLDRPTELEGATYKLKWPDSEHAIYITVNDIVAHGQRRPFEVFINSKNMDHFAWTVALTRMISAVFRRGGDVSFVVEELKAVFDPRGGAWMGGKYIPSILAAIGGVIERHMIAIGFLAAEGAGLKSDPHAAPAGDRPRGKACPSCGSYDVHMVEGCLTCANCGFSKCG
ncbi:adenosylcobalamin-dependent ribonucleoside-diphosphate reductase [Wenxinia saemankumensis]|uniref:Vitamin B12-dependent ribonucleotide reductase n=1 Tax=Wenxinia saemankumensis TaxID=1447782 RepID=A0A1M6FH87_9RHOB|nr:adenosylcobalamin-dependent ribonucleoside-diphosphate reductase [Wenxinia saemankumensis]SHI97006.1 ribonucleoside-diphosphate reductase class II [Wenxinia saemankumensis]